MKAQALDQMLEADERVVFRTRGRPRRLKALAFGFFLVFMLLVAAFIVIALTDETGFWLAVTGMVGGLLLTLVFCLWLQAEITITDRRILMGGGVIAWLFGIGPKGLSIDPSEIDLITATDSGWHSAITIILLDSRRFSLWVFKRHRQFEQSLKDILDKPSRWMIITE